MAVASDVIGVLDELRATEGSIRRARIIGRLWNLARTLPTEERRELAQVLAERYAPKVAERLGAGADVQSGELLEMVRAVGKVDADEISDIMDQLQTSGGRRELLADVAESLRDDLAEVDIETLIDDPDARAAALAAAGRELAEDMELVDAVVDPDPAGDAKTLTTDGNGREPLHEGDPTDPREEEHTAPDASVDTETVGGVVGTDAVETTAHGEPGTDVDESPARRVWSPVWDPDQDAAIVPATTTDPDVLTQAAEVGTWDMTEPQIDIDIHLLAAARSPIDRLRLLRASISRIDGTTGADLMGAFPDGWQRRRAAAVVVSALLPGDVAGAARVINSLDSASDRRWIVRSLLADWPLDEAAAARLVTTTNVPLAVMRLSHRDQQPQWGP